MASEAKGQIGGLDMNEEARERLASESRVWKCGGCGGKSNEEVILECEARWREQHVGGEVDLASRSSDIQIPEELRLAYKDDMERGPPTPNTKLTAGSSNSKDDNESSQAPARAGAVASILARPKPPPSPLRMTATARGPGRGMDTSRVPTATSNLRYGGNSSPASSTTATSAVLRTAALPIERPPEIATSQAAVPKWLDLAIFGTVLGMIFMVIRKVVG